MLEVGTLHPSSCGHGVKTRSVVLLLTSSETMFVLKGIPAHPVQLNLLEMSWFITPPVGFNYCLHGDDICSLSLAGWKGIRKHTHAHTHTLTPPQHIFPLSALHLILFPACTASQYQWSGKAGLDLQIQKPSRDQ